MIVPVCHQNRALLVHHHLREVIEARGRALAVGIASLPVASYRAHRPLHRHPPHCVVALVGHQNAPVLVPRQGRWEVEARGGALPVCKPSLPVAGQRAHGAAGRDDPDRVVLGVCHDDLVVGRQHHADREVEACGFALTVCEARLPVAGQRADLAGLGHAAQGVVSAVHNHDVAGRVHRDAARVVEARIGALAVLKARIFVLAPRDESELPRGRQQLQRVLLGADQAGAVGHHKHAVGLTQPGHLEGGHGGVEGGGARALCGRRCNHRMWRVSIKRNPDRDRRAVTSIQARCRHCAGQWRRRGRTYSWPWSDESSRMSLGRSAVSRCVQRTSVGVRRRESVCVGVCVHKRRMPRMRRDGRRGAKLRAGLAAQGGSGNARRTCRGNTPRRPPGPGAL